jgi:hypothetical protein
VSESKIVMGMNHDSRIFAVAHPHAGGRGDGRRAAGRGASRWASAVDLRGNIIMSPP